MRIATRGLFALTLVCAGIAAIVVPAHAKETVGSGPPGVGGILLRQGQTLRAGDSVVLHGWRLKLRTDGELVLYRPGGVYVWMSETGFHQPKRLTFQRDGNLVLYNAANRPVWDSRTSGLGLTKGVLRLSETPHTPMGKCEQRGALEVSGTLAGGRSSYVWTSCTLSTLSQSSALPRGGVLVSPHSGHVLMYGLDGNLALYSARGVSWVSNTARRPSKLFGVNPTANGPAVYNGPFNHAVWSQSGTTASSALRYRWFALQDDGNLVFYEASDLAHTQNVHALWSTNTAGR